MDKSIFTVSSEKGTLNITLRIQKYKNKCSDLIPDSKIILSKTPFPFYLK